MGNNWSSILPSQCNKHNPFDQPKIFGKFPQPESIEKIQPSLTFFKSKSDPDGLLLVDHSKTLEEAFQLINTSFPEFNQPQPQCRLVILTHGFRSDKNTEWLHLVKDAILDIDSSTQPSGDRRQIPVILGWGGGSDIGLLNYSLAASNCLETGRWLGNFVKEFHQKFPQVEIYGIGHSLGAHLMGMAGRSSSGSFDRLTGLDPAGPGFQTDNEDKRLQRDDAKLVDVIHTDGQDVPYYGTLVPMGKIDFYPNYGWDQPSNDGAATAKPMIDLDSYRRKAPQPSEYGGFISESHGRAIDFFLWSILNPGKFRTHLRLESEPGVESGVHRIQAVPLELGVEVEMGYHLDSFVRKHFQQKCSQTSVLQPRLETETETETAEAQPETEIEDRKNLNYFQKYFGNYYVHTNGRAPWC